ncbi:MAG: DUF2927 domain-containing protein [Pseudomonadota bacterium]
MRRLIMVLALTLGGCAQVSGGIDWYDFLEIEQGVGRMRADRTPQDAPVDQVLLEQNFRRIAFDLESDPLGNGDPQGENDRPMIRKWLKPVIFSLASTLEDEAAISPRLDSFARLLSDVTGHPVRPYEDSGDGSVRLLIIYGPDRSMRAMTDPRNISGPEWTKNEQGAARWLAASIAEWRIAPSPCAGYVLVGDERTDSEVGEIIFAVVMIRKEVPDLLLDACIEEELAQVMGVLNDDDTVRPSVFNDDQEFALLTDHDTELLRALYDPRIKPGMTPAEAMPIVREILGEAHAGG